MSDGNGRDAILQERHIVEVKLSDLQSEFLFDLSLTLQAPLDIGSGPEGHRLIVMTSGGRFQGPRLSGTVLPLPGADWPRIRSDGTCALDARASQDAHDLRNERREYRLAKWRPRGGSRPHWTRRRGISRPPGAVKRSTASTSELERRVLWVWIP